MIVRSRSILLDAEALSALSVDDRRMQAWATVARRTDSRLHASAVTLAEVTDGSARDARVRRIARAIRIEEVTELIGYRAGGLQTKAAGARRKRRDLTVDAIVAATALFPEGPVVVLTSDPRALELLLSETSVIVQSIA